jgi:hypothetical protein
MAVLAVQDVVSTGLNPTFGSAAGGGDSFPNDGQTMFRVKNGSAGSINVTFDSARECSYGFDHNIVADVAAGADMTFGPFPRMRFNDANERVVVSYSAVTSVTVAAIRMVPAPS